MSDKLIDKVASLEYCEKRIQSMVDTGRLSRKEGRAVYDQAKEGYRRGNYERVLDAVKEGKR
jgi:hypothetical protein